MAGHTSRLNLYLPGGGSSGLYLPDEQLDVDRINDNMKLIDDAVGFQVVTSGTRPASPYVGKGIFETDTKRIRLWTGATWAASTAERGTAALFTAPDKAAMLLITGPDVIVGDLCCLQSSSSIYRYNGINWLPTMALVPIVPTSMSGSGATLGAGGVITLTAATSLSILGCFTAEFDNYLIEFDIITQTTLAGILVQLMNGAAPVTTGYTATSIFTVNSAAPTANDVSSGGTGWIFGGGSGARKRGSMTIYGPVLGEIKAMSFDSYTAPGVVKGIGGGEQSSTASLTGLALSALGTASGTARIYGYSNN